MSWRRLALWAIGAAASLVAGVLAFAWSGLYSVAASEGHFAFIDYLLRFGMRNSVKTHARGIEAPPFDDDMVKLGAVHFERACRTCHGAPGKRPNPITQQTLPPAPNLTELVDKWRDRELFWIVKHGLKYTAMPGWTAQNRDDEVWSVIAFSRQLPKLDSGAYRQLAGDASETSKAELFAEPPPGGTTSVAQKHGCVSCHGDEKTGPESSLVPALNGQTERMLKEALHGYADNQRPSEIMQPVASQLNDAQIDALAKAYANFQTVAVTRADIGATPESVARGERMFATGDAKAGIPACISCHNDDALASYPRLSGQSPKYVSGQLRLWRGGGRRLGPLAQIMAPIAERLSDQQIEDVSAYIASMRPAGAAPAPSGQP